MERQLTWEAWRIAGLPDPGEEPKSYVSPAQFRAAGKEVIVKRRLYFLLPDTEHTRSVVDELELHGIEPRYMHVIAAQGVDLEGLPVAARNQGNDLGAQLETVLWYGNLGLFFIALAVLIVLALLHVSWFWTPATWPPLSS